MRRVIGLETIDNSEWKNNEPTVGMIRTYIPPENSLEKATAEYINKNKGVKNDQGKLDYTLLPWSSIKEVVKVLMFGAAKYPSADNWKHVEPSRYKKAAMRHLVAYLEGEKNDSESGHPHLAHCMCCILFLLYFQLKGEDDVK